MTVVGTRINKQSTKLYNKIKQTEGGEGKEKKNSGERKAKMDMKLTAATGAFADDGVCAGAHAAMAIFN